MRLERVNELRTLAMLLRQGEAPNRALGRLASRSSAWRTAAEAAERGAPLATALESLLPAGTSGTLASAEDVPGVLDELAVLLQQTLRRRRKWGSVMAYPVFLLTVIAGAMVLGNFAIHPFVALFEGMSLSLPLATQIIIVFSKALTNPAILIPLAVFLGPPLLGGLWLVFGWSWSRLMLPVLGAELRNQEAQGFLSWLAFLVERGHPLPEAVRAAAGACSARPMRRQMERCAEELEKGGEVEAAVSRLTWFPGLARWLIVSAFRTPAPGAALLEAARLMARDSELQAGNSAAVIETALMLLIGFGVGFIVIALFLPLYQLIGNLG